MPDKNNLLLRIGKISYANLFPIYYYLENKCDHSKYKFINGVPSSLNKMLRDGKIDLSPSSSIEFLRRRKKYSIIPWLSISSEGPIRSIFLFSKYPLESLNKKSIAVSSQSETSVVLLKIILRDFYSLKCRFVTVKSGSLKRLLSDFPACLFIGDDAMKAKKQLTVDSSQLSVNKKTADGCFLTSHSSLITHHSNPPFPPLSKGGEGGFYIYDLGDLWFKHTGLPFVFALWIVRNETLLEKKEPLKSLSSDLIAAKKFAHKNFSLISRYALQRKWLSGKELVTYWKGISYDFTERHMEGLKLFEKYVFADFKKRD
ncbi:MAG: menaquinone biosynthesis protein [Nitrospirae bacterium]|nr:menaquinone biosynthesis protein [Nitrospirota bacterium]